MQVRLEQENATQEALTTMAAKIAATTLATTPTSANDNANANANNANADAQHQQMPTTMRNKRGDATRYES
jgi:hypothetical protein